MQTVPIFVWIVFAMIFIIIVMIWTFINKRIKSDFSEGHHSYLENLVYGGCLSLLVCSVACNNEKDESYTSIDVTAKTNAINIVPERIIDGDAFPFARKYFVHKDSVLVVFNRSDQTAGSQNIPFFEFRKLCDTTLLKKMIYRGNGPDEMLNGQCEYQDSCLYVIDFVKNKFTDLNIDSILNMGKLVLNFKERGFLFSNFKKYKDGSYIFDNYNCFTNKELKIKQNANRFIVGDGSIGDSHKYKYNAFNANQGNVLVNPNKDRVLYFNNSQPEIEVYDYDLNLLNRIIGPDESLAKYSLDNDNSVVFYDKIPWYYCDYIYDDERIFITYHGVLIRDDPSRIPGLIFEFDWDGNFLASYNPHEPIVTLSIWKKDKRVLYITSTDSLGQAVLDKIVLPSIQKN